MTEQTTMPTREPIGDAEIDLRLDLVAEDERYGPEHPVPVKESGVSFGRLLSYPIGVDDLPVALRSRARSGRHTYHGLILAFDLDELPLGRRYTEVRVTVDLADEETIAVLADADHRFVFAGPTWAWSLSDNGGGMSASLSGLHTAHLGCVYRPAKGGDLESRSYTCHLVIEAPAGTRVLDGSYTVAVEISRTVFDFTTRRVAGLGSGVTFALPLAAEYERPAVRLCLSVDIEKFSRLGNEAAKHAQKLLLDVLDEALGASGISQNDPALQQSGDGRFLIFPSGLDESVAVPGLISGLRGGLHRVNAGLSAQEGIRLRAALHRGLVQAAPNGFVGEATIAVHRLLDCDPVRDALKATTGDLALIVPDFLYRDVMARGYGDFAEDDFIPVTVDIPEKNFTAACLVHAPDRTW